MPKLRLLQVALLAGALVAGSAAAETVRLSASLQPSSEVPPTATHGSGAVDASYDTATHTLKWTITYENLTGPATAAHFHGPAPVGQNAGVQVPIPKDELASPIKGSKVLTDAQVTELMGGKWYFNVHTKEHPSGEIRGQLMPAN
ncbi:CHRD domain-containing protein [Burkholderia pseudomultivorans]|uniref:CHRD domain-containing protein n=1 Tax=Burkholderia pseudomultivorans TaxID=1207504 RepID=UPI00075E7674|nr:CHRD domain-containing protein [Burkholderia pseudomultivorans]AOI93335.1 CHRD domain-containing protein [Burkholderia pseudomultivorans]KVC39735.1 CHRD domain-containing protein [Burkholderia pseudomultivorans]KVG66030.1 CHRD domain-containing protein [Burkholderia pseudomultivorans]KWF02545.1 CHRD domain-containing protein [Burkholderia pseudomultivorans]MBF5013239.1 CHRD domain-containing protein [Burkholderia pseudomultivorans]